ncbi:pyrimidine/purine nucleoside phosphorylase [Zoogloea sp.]|uniref:pyrimidine/purine nucleoside phosphorylase n=1 Tax=Zoogloea sp. TaxID=49181 RepID=UPI0035B1AD9A
MTQSVQFDGVSVIKKANVYFDGKCVSHTVIFADGSKKTVGVILPASLTFNTGEPEVMETVAGACRYRLKGESEWKVSAAGESFNVPGNSSFDIEVSGEPYHYVCYFG